MSYTVQKYPFDQSGTALTNRIVGEVRRLPSIPSSGGIRLLVPKFAPFYSQSIKVFDVATSALLTPSQYDVLYLHEHLTILTRQEVCCLIAIKDPSVSDQIELVYQTVGGEFGQLRDVILELIQTLSLDDRTVNFNDIQGKPAAFPPARHKQDLSTITGFQRLANAVRSITQAVLVGDRKAHEQIINLFNDRLDGIEVDVMAARHVIEQALDTHVQNTNNPHNLTKTHVQLGLAPNYPPATTTVALTGDSDASLMTPFTTRLMIQTYARSLLDDHIADTNNPHGTTKSHLGLGMVANNRPATVGETVSGVLDNVNVTPLGVAQAIQHQALAPLAVHANTQGNPHGTTATDVDLGLAPNFPPATINESREGLRDDVLMTPYLTYDLMEIRFVVPMLDHLNITAGNPHGTTKGHLGLDRVDNLSLADYGNHFAPILHSHGYDSLPFTLADANKWTQGANDIANLPPFNPAGNYPALRAGGTRKEDVNGLENVPNWSEADWYVRFAAKDHDHGGTYLTKDEADAAFVTTAKYQELLNYASAYANYAVAHYGRGESVTAPTPPA